MYIEADAWATNLKQKLACGSVLMSAKMEYYEFFTRALQPNVHFVEVSTNDMCHDTASKVNTNYLLFTALIPVMAISPHGHILGSCQQGLNISCAGRF